MITGDWKNYPPDDNHDYCVLCLKWGPRWAKMCPTCYDKEAIKIQQANIRHGEAMQVLEWLERSK